MCFGSARREDFGGERPARKLVHGRGRGRRGNRENDAYYGGGGGPTDHKTPAAATYDHQPYAATDDYEAGQKAYHDGARKDHQADAGGHGPTYVHDKQADHGTPKLPALHNKAGDVAGYAFTPRLHGAADRRVNAAVDYNHYPSTTANTTLAR